MKCRKKRKSLLQQNPDNINQKYFQQQPTSNTRNSARGKLNVPIHCQAKFQSSPLFQTIKTSYTCPVHLLKDTIKMHKTQHQKYLIEKIYKRWAKHFDEGWGLFPFIIFSIIASTARNSIPGWIKHWRRKRPKLIGPTPWRSPARWEGCEKDYPQGEKDYMN